MNTWSGNPTLEAFFKIEQDISSTFEDLCSKLQNRKKELLKRLDGTRQDYMVHESKRMDNLREINAYISQLESQKLKQTKVYDMQQQEIERSKQLRQQFEHPIIVTTFPKFCTRGLDALMAQIDTLGAVEEVSTSYNAKSRPSKRLASDSTKRVTIDRPMGVALDELNRLYVANLGNAQIQVLRLDGEQVMAFGIGKLSMPHSIAICEQNVFVTDFALNSIVKFQKPDYRMVSSTKEGELGRPLGITVDRNKNVLVADSNNNRVVAYSIDLDKVGEFGTKTLNKPQDVKVHLDQVLVADHGLQHNIHLFSNTGQLIQSILKVTSGASWLFLAMDIFGNILISDYSGKRVQVLSVDGQAVPSIECRYFATGIAVAGNNQTIIAEFANNRINVYD